MTDMVGRKRYENRPSEEVFEEALRELRRGKIPDTMPFVAAYIHDAGKERGLYMDAITECAFRLQQSNKVLREMATSLQQSLLRALGRAKKESVQTRDLGPLILWLSAKIKTEQENGRQSDAEMLTQALDAVLLSVPVGRGSSNDHT